jgi:hypothetical protein
MTTPPSPEPGSDAPHGIGLRRYSVVQFLIAMVAVLIGIPFLEQFDTDGHLATLLITLVLVSGVLAVSGRRRTLILGMILMLPALIGSWTHQFWPEHASAVFHYIAGLVFLGFLIWEFLRFILRAPRVNSEVICAGISIYLLLGLLWMTAYLLVARGNPDAFTFATGPAVVHSLHGADAFYFSFATLCTLGYGDIVPVSHAARMLAAMEAITGTLYVAVLISRLVALYSSAAMQPDGRKD